MQAQLQVLTGVAVTPRPNTRSNVEVSKLQIFNRKTGKILSFLTVYRLFIRMRIRDNSVKEQIQQILSYMQEGSVNIWKENVLEDLKARILEYRIIGGFLTDIKIEFGGEDNKIMKIVDLKKEKVNRMMEEFIQEFRRIARDSGYEGRLLVEKFK